MTITMNAVRKHTRQLLLKLYNIVNDRNTMRGSRKFVRGGTTLTTFLLVDAGRAEDPYTTKSGHHRPTNACWLGSSVIFQEIRTSIGKKPYIFVIFQGGPYPLSPPLDPCMNTHNGNMKCYIIHY